jgi:tRNA U38,U39,U40 pseudouridine synthase TruA
VLAARERSAAGETAPAQGLTLAEVRYAQRLGIPAPARSLWLEDGWLP